MSSAKFLNCSRTASSAAAASAKRTCASGSSATFAPSTRARREMLCSWQIWSAPVGNRIREVSLTEATPATRDIYQKIFGDRDPVAEPGTATGSRGDYWATPAVVPDPLKMAADTVWALLQPGRVLDPRYRDW